MRKGKPNKKYFILVNGGFGMMGGMGLFMSGFFLLHLMPVWIYLGGVLFSFRKYKNTAYLIADKGIYVSGGVFT